MMRSVCNIRRWREKEGGGRGGVNTVVLGFWGVILGPLVFGGGDIHITFYISSYWFFCTYLLMSK